MKNKIFQIAVNVVFLIGFMLAFMWIFSIALNKQEKKECLQYQWYASQYPAFYMTQWQKDQCDSHGIEIPAPVEKKIEVKPDFAEVEATVYAYNSVVEQTDIAPEIMASGKHVYDGAIACPDPFSLSGGKDIKDFESFGHFGDQVEINGKIYTCEDRMASQYRADWNFDIWMPSVEQAFNWGVRKIKVKIYIN